MKRNDESVSQGEIQITINLEKQGIGTKSYFITSIPETTLVPQIIDQDETSFSEIETPVIAETNI